MISPRTRGTISPRTRGTLSPRRQAGADPLRAIEAAAQATPPHLALIHAVLDAGLAGVDAVLPVTHSTLLALAGARACMPLLQLAVERGAAVDGVAGSSVADTPLTACIAAQFLPGVEFLLARGASARKANGKGYSPMYVLMSEPAAWASDRDRAAGAGSAATSGATPSATPTRVGSDGSAGGVVAAGSAPPQETEADVAFVAAALRLLTASGALADGMPSPVVACAKRGSVPVLRLWLAARPGGGGAAAAAGGRLASVATASVALADAVAGGRWAMVEALLDERAPLQGVRRADACLRAVANGAPLAVVRKLLTREVGLGPVLAAAVAADRADVVAEVAVAGADTSEPGARWRCWVCRCGVCVCVYCCGVLT
jgi:hypothetical protein